MELSSLESTAAPVVKTILMGEHDDVTTQSISPGRLQMAMRLELAQDVEIF